METGLYIDGLSRVQQALRLLAGAPVDEMIGVLEGMRLRGPQNGSERALQKIRGRHLDQDLPVLRDSMKLWKRAQKMLGAIRKDENRKLARLQRGGALLLSWGKSWKPVLLRDVRSPEGWVAALVRDVGEVAPRGYVLVWTPDGREWRQTRKVQRKGRPFPEGMQPTAAQKFYPSCTGRTLEYCPAPDQAGDPVAPEDLPAWPSEKRTARSGGARAG